MSRITAYWFDLRTLPGDALLAYRHEGWAGAWKAVASRSLHRVLRSGRLIVFAHPVEQMVDVAPPAGVRITQPTGQEWARLASLVGRRELQRFLALSARGRRCLVAWRGDTPVGYAWVAGDLGPDVALSPLPLAFPSSAAYLLNLYVSSLRAKQRDRLGSRVGPAPAGWGNRVSRGLADGSTHQCSLTSHRAEERRSNPGCRRDSIRSAAGPHLRPLHSQRQVTV